MTPDRAARIVMRLAFERGEIVARRRARWGSLEELLGSAGLVALSAASVAGALDLDMVRAAAQMVVDEPIGVVREMLPDWCRLVDFGIMHAPATKPPDFSEYDVS